MSLRKHSCSDKIAMLNLNMEIVLGTANETNFANRDPSQIELELTVFTTDMHCSDPYDCNG